MTNIQFIAKSVQAPAVSIQNTVKLLEEDCTIPFISRYRKDATGNLDETVIEQIAKLQKDYDTLIKRKEAVLKSIEEQKALTPELKKVLIYKKSKIFTFHTKRRKKQKPMWHVNLV